jgi:hypothetical protein
MAEMELTAKQVAEALGVGIDTIGKWLRDKERKRFPRAYMLHDSPYYGYRIPIGDVAAYAESQSPAYREEVSKRLPGLNACA